MNICGITIESNNINIAVIQTTETEKNYTLFNIGVLKIPLENETEQESIKLFSQKVKDFVFANNIDIIGIKKRLHKGKFSGGAISFKIEAIIQLLDDVQVFLIPAKTITSKSKNIEIPKSLFKYQHEAFKTAYTTMKEEQFL